MTVTQGSKVYCQCKDKYSEFYGLVGADETKKNTIQWVHWPCGKPTEMVWREWLAPCAICLSLFSSPWSIVCKSCHRETGSSDPFHGWAWARKQDQEFRKKLLDSSLRLWYREGVGTETGGPVTPQGRTPE